VLAGNTGRCQAYPKDFMKSAFALVPVVARIRTSGREIVSTLGQIGVNRESTIMQGHNEAQDSLAES
jgi:hypothetical protein